MANLVVSRPVVNAVRWQQELPAAIHSDRSDTAGLSYYWFVLKRNRTALFAFAVLGLVLGFLSTLSQEPVFKARSSVEIVGLNDNFLNLKQASPVSEAGSATDTDIQTQIRILQSDSLVDQVIAQLKRQGAPVKFRQDRIAAWRRILHLPEISAKEAYEQELQSAAKSLKARAAGLTRIIEISVDSRQPQLAAEFANALANGLMEHNLEARWRTTEKTGAWLSRQLDDMRVKLERSEDALQTYARNSGLIFTDEKSNISEEKLRDLQQALLRAQDDRIAKQSRYEMAASSSPDALPDVLNNAGLQAEQTELTGLRRQLADLTISLTPEHVKVKRMQAQIASLESALARDRGLILNRIRNEYEEAAKREKLLATAYESQAKLVSGQGEQAIQYSILKREVDTNRQLYEAMLQQWKESSIASAMRASNVRILDVAKVPVRPFKPNPRQASCFGMFAGVLLGMVFIVIRDRADRTIRAPGDLETYLRVSELGIIPSAESKSLAGGRNGINGNAVPANLLALAGGVKSAKLELASCDTGPSIVAESFRSILVSLLFADDRAARPKVMVLTSASPGEGKSTIASNLAIVIAQIGQKVLLIDSDLRKPRQHGIFEINNARGVTTLLRGEGNSGGSRRFSRLIQETIVPNLSLLPSGPPTTTASNLLCSADLPELLDYVRAEYDAVIIDSPPMLQMPDARILGRLADGVILVVRSGKTTRDTAFSAKKRLTEDGTRLIGTILNDWNAKHAAYGYYTYHSESYQQDPAEAEEVDVDSESVHSV